MRLAWVVAPLLVLTFVAPAAAIVPSPIVVDTGIVPGDTYSFKLNPESGPGFKIKAGSSMVITGLFGPSFPREWSAGYAFTDRFSVSGAAFSLGAVVGSDGVGGFNPLTGDEWHVEVLTNTPSGIQIDLNEPRFGASHFTLTVNFATDTHFNGDVDWHFGLAIPEAHSIRVQLDLTFDKDMDTFASDIASTGSVIPAEEFDGTFQSYSAYQTTSLDMQAQASVAAQRAAYAWLVPYNPGSGTGIYSIDGPGGSDGTYVDPYGGAFTNGAIVHLGNGGTYVFEVPAATSSGNPDTFPASSAGYAAVLWGLELNP